MLKKESDEKIKLIVKNNLNDIEQSIARLIGLFLDLDTYCHSLCETKCGNIKMYMHNLMAFYQNELKKILTDEFESLLKSISYPYNKEAVQHSALSQAKALSAITNPEIRNYPNINSSNETKLRVCINRLINVEAYQSRCMKQKNDSKNDENIIICLLIKPLEKRFRYHFLGTRKTNNLEKVNCLFAWFGHIFKNFNFLSLIFHF